MELLNIEFSVKVKQIETYVKLIALALTLATVASCKTDRPRPSSEGSAVTYYNEIPSDCNTVKGLKQSVVKQVHSEKELIGHYGLTFKVHFQDKTSPDLYGALYYQDEVENKYCMALTDGRFAIFTNKKLGEHSMNMVQEVCYPISPCN